MKGNKMKIIPNSTFISLSALTLLISCGQNQTDSQTTAPGNTRTEDSIPLDGSNIVGRYQAKFVTLNPHVNGTIPGSANFFRKEDKIFAYVRLFAGGPKAWHMQHVYTGNRCPEIKDDMNGDGFIDILEAEAVLGKILIPLDSDISTQAAGKRFFPLADLSGYYHYERITRFDTFLRDLQKEDEDPLDRIVKLSPDEGLELVGKTVLIQGVAETVQLPDTVESMDRRKSFQTLPIACGVFEKADLIPGEVYLPDQIPGPIAEVQEGQDRPADIETEDTQTEGGGNPTSTNESDEGDGPVSDGNGNRRDSTTNTNTPSRTNPPTREGETQPRTDPQTETGGSLPEELPQEETTPIDPQNNTTGGTQT